MESTQHLETECNIVLTKSQGEEKNMKNKMQNAIEVTITRNAVRVKEEHIMN